MSTEDDPLLRSFTNLVGDGAVDTSRAKLDTIYNDEVSEMTLSRRLARFLSRYTWYLPENSDSPAPPSLDAAWAYFEHATLARYIENPPEGGSESSSRRSSRLMRQRALFASDMYQRAEPGEKDRDTRLYPVIDTPEKDLADFGVGVGVYFYTLRMLAFIMFIAGCSSIPNLLYFSSDSYNSAPEFDTFHALKASAVCTDQSWVPCPNCTKAQMDFFPATFERYAEAVSKDGQVLTFIRKNNCHIAELSGIMSFSTMLFVCIAVYILAKVTKRKERLFDEAAQTTTDYSVNVTNPPPDARDPHEWKQFFSQFGPVTSITVALDNEELMRLLMKRRKLLWALENIQPPSDTSISPQDLDEIKAAVETALPVPWYYKYTLGTMDGPAIGKAIAKIDETIDEKYKDKVYDVSDIFCIFETEAAQQAALKALKVPGKDIMFNNKSNVPSNLLFREEFLLEVVEPPEPSSVRWQDLDESFGTKLKQQIFTAILTIIFVILGCCFVVYIRYKEGPVYSALAVTAVNSAAPYICEYIVMLESHPSEDARQTSLYFKITAFLWTTTAMLTAFITPFVETLENQSDSLIPAMYAIFITEMLKAPATQLLDITGHVYRHVLGPRAIDQKRMNYYFQGTVYQLSERYTDMTNILFLTFYYAVLFPAGFFLGSITLMVHYWTDKFCLLRNWAPAPIIGNKIANMSRTYFFSSALVVYAIISSYNYASFPYDNVCEATTTASTEYIGTFENLVTGDGRTNITTTVSDGDSNYFYCNQDMLRFDPPAFPAIPQNQPEGAEWMTHDQDFAKVYGITSVVVVVFVILIVLNKIREELRGFFGSPYKANNIVADSANFSDVPDIFAYIPQAKLLVDPYPLLFCDISNIDEELISWVDPNASYEIHNCIYDIAGLKDKNVFSTVHHWPAGK